MTRNVKFTEIIATAFLSIPAMYALYEINTKFVDLGMHTGRPENNAALFPRLLSYSILGLIAIRIIMLLIEKRKEQPKEERSFIDRGSIPRLLMMLLVFVLLLIGLIYIGYYVTAPLVFFLSLRILGAKNYLKNAILSIVVPLAIWFIFSELLQIVLPVGKFGLYF